VTPLPPDDAHRRPDGASDDVVAAVGKLSEALEWIERAKGRLYDFHQLIGHADFLLDEAAARLEDAGRDDLAAEVREDVIGRNVLPGRWTFQVVEEFTETYYEPFAAMERRAREQLLDGKRHVFEAELKEQRRTPGRPGHESRPATG
jgi:hypothetical protein